MLDITYRSETEAQFEIPETLTWFNGHFPGQPILPGFAIIEFSKQVIARKYSLAVNASLKIRNAKFSRPVMPKTVIVAKWEVKEKGYVMVWQDNANAEEIASLSLEFS